MAVSRRTQLAKISGVTERLELPLRAKLLRGKTLTGLRHLVTHHYRSFALILGHR